MCRYIKDSKWSFANFLLSHHGVGARWPFFRQEEDGTAVSFINGIDNHASCGDK